MTFLQWVKNLFKGSKTTTPIVPEKHEPTMLQRVAPLLDYIALNEVGTKDPWGYGVISGFIKKSHYPPKAIVSMTVEEILSWQHKIDRHQMSEAVGRYQIMEDTLRSMVLPEDLNRLFDKDMQDEYAIALLERRGLNQLISGKLSLEAFALGLAKEWASIPLLQATYRKVKGKTVVIPAGSSYYSGDGLNASHAKLSSFKSVLSITYKNLQQ